MIWTVQRFNFLVSKLSTCLLCYKCLSSRWDCLWVYPLAITTSQDCYFHVGSLVDCNRSGCVREGDIDWRIQWYSDGLVVKPYSNNQAFQLIINSTSVLLQAQRFDICLAAPQTKSPLLFLLLGCGHVIKKCSGSSLQSVRLVVHINVSPSGAGRFCVLQPVMANGRYQLRHVITLFSTEVGLY